MAAFIPGASPPLVRTAMRFIDPPNKSRKIEIKWIIYVDFIMEVDKACIVNSVFN
jgi:hypothetical protein